VPFAACSSSANDGYTRGLGPQRGRARFPAHHDVSRVVVIHNRIMCDHPTVAAEFCAARDVADTDALRLCLIC
jgi:hypothetical protein